MNKFIIALATIALVGAASAHPTGEPKFFDDQEELESLEVMTQFGGFPNNEEEVARLSPEKDIFRDFCHTARDDVKSFLSSAVNHKVSEAFKFVAESFVSASLQVGEETGKVVEEGEKEIAGDASKAVAAANRVLETIKHIASQEFFNKVQEFKEQLNGENAIDLIKKTCNAVTFKLTDQIETLLTETKKKLIAADADKAVVKEAKLSNLGCTTMTRLSLVSRGCELLAPMIPVISKYFQ